VKLSIYMPVHCDQIVTEVGEIGRKSGNGENRRTDDGGQKAEDGRLKRETGPKSNPYENCLFTVRNAEVGVDAPDGLPSDTSK
jgi:hypothetical protein